MIIFTSWRCVNAGITALNFSRNRAGRSRENRDTIANS